MARAGPRRPRRPARDCSPRRPVSTSSASTLSRRGSRGSWRPIVRHAPSQSSTRWSRSTPLDESLWGMLMLALYRDGRQGDALKAFHRARAVIVEELGRRPSRPSWSACSSGILEHDPGLELRGEPLRGYRLLEKLDDGRSGVLYRAIQPKVGRDVAVRVFHEQVAADSDLRAPIRAASAARRRSRAPAHRAGLRLLAGARSGLPRDTLPEEAAASVHSWNVARRSTPNMRSASSSEIAGALAFAHRQAVVPRRRWPLGDPASTGRGMPTWSTSCWALTRSPIAAGMSASGARWRGGCCRRTRGWPSLPDSRSLDIQVDAEDPAASPEGASGPVVSAATPEDARNPYKGLRPFSEADAGDFSAAPGSWSPPRAPLGARAWRALPGRGRAKRGGQLLGRPGRSGAAYGLVPWAGRIDVRGGDVARSTPVTSWRTPWAASRSTPIPDARSPEVGLTRPAPCRRPPGSCRRTAHLSSTSSRRSSRSPTTKRTASGSSKSLRVAALDPRVG